MRLWITGAKVLTAHKDSTMSGSGQRTVTWHTTENDPNTATALNVARYLNTTSNQVHLVWNPTTGEMVQMIPANRGGRGLQNQSGGVLTNTRGTINFQIEVVGKASQPWTSGPCKNLGVILAFLQQLGIPNSWPSGDLAGSYAGPHNRSTTTWMKSGHFGHSQAPENSHWDPGNIDQSKVTGGVVVIPVVNPTVPSTTTRVYCYRGDRGPAVVRVQKIVGVTADGSFGPGTEAAVKKWQAAKKILADGKWGPNTEATYQKSLLATKPPTTTAPKPVNPVTGRFPLSSGHYFGRDDGRTVSHSGVRAGDATYVKMIQRKVGATVDGRFGPGTESKVIAWQKRNIAYIADKLANGKVGPNTWAAMLKV